MKKWKIALLSACWLSAALCLEARSKRAADPEAVVPIRWEKLDLRPLQDELAREVRQIMLNANKYALNKWYGPVKGYGAQTDRCIDFGGIGEHSIRPSANEAFALAVSLKFRIYDAAWTGVSEREAVSRTLRLIGSLAARHKANAGGGGWGYEWQSAFWAAQAATAAWMMWNELEPAERETVRRMTVAEADRLIDYRVPYYMDPEGHVVFKGDSKAEENAWNSQIMAIATAMMPRHPHWQAWYDKGVELQLSAFARPSDRMSRKTINGMRLDTTLRGSNVDEYGIVINHHILHPDYLTTVLHNATNAWIYALAGQKMPRASLFNGGLVYRTMAEHPVGDGRTMYVRGDRGEATSRMYYPEGNDWGGQRQGCFLAMDVMAMVFGWDRGMSPSARDWALARTREMLRMQARDTTGQYYQRKEEDLYPAREEWIAYHIGYCYLGLWMKEHPISRFTDKRMRPRR